MRADLSRLPTETEAAKFATALISSYPGAGKDDGIKGYMRQLATALRGYPVSIVEQMLHPRLGVPGMVEGFPFPSLASINRIANSLIETRAARLRSQEAILETEELCEAEKSATPEERERGFAVWQAIKAAAKARTWDDTKRVGPEYFGIQKKEADRLKLEALKTFAPEPEEEEDNHGA